MKRATLEAIVARALARMDLASRTAASLPSRPPSSPVRVVAIGKASPAMTRGALDRWGDRIESVLVVAPDGTDASTLLGDRRVELLRASHPLPDRRSVRAAERCLSFVASSERPRRRDLHLRELASDATHAVLVLVSGGASALVCAPVEGVTLGDKRAVTRTMLASGATVQEINVVRKHLSRIKGGGLARAAGSNRVLTIAASDVIGGVASDIGSGPSVVDGSTVGRARALLRRHAPRFAALPLVRTLDAKQAMKRSLSRPKIVASPEELASVAASELAARGIRARVLPASQADVAVLAEEYASRAAKLARGAALVRAAEPSVRPRGRGRGGRCTHLAALVAPTLPRGVTLLALATDGVDGASGTGGAIVDAGLVARAGREAIEDALDRFDTGVLHRAFGTAIASSPSGHNLADLHVLVRS